MSFAEAFREDRAAPAEKKKPARPRKDVVAAAAESLQLQAELIRFAHVAREQRTRVASGSAMPLQQQENWSRLVGAIDAFLERAPTATAPSDVIRARVATEAELDMDARAYGDFPPQLAEHVLDRVTRLAVRMSELRRLQVKPVATATSFEWPIEPVFVTSLFGRRLHPVTGDVRSHFGVDLDAYNGQLVSAAGKGTVVRAGWNGAHGRQVELQHPGGVLTRYSHLSAILVEPGAVVEKGDPLGLAGSTGVSTGVHLHFEFWRDGRPRDPLEELAEQSTRSADAVPAGKTPRS